LEVAILDMIATTTGIGLHGWNGITSKTNPLKKRIKSSDKHKYSFAFPL